MSLSSERIKRIKDAGFEISIAHYRISSSTGKYFRTYRNNRVRKKYIKTDYEHFGGMTTVWVGKQKFVAKCSDKDRFCFASGLDIAVARAFNYFLEHLVVKSQPVALPQESPKNEAQVFDQKVRDETDGLYRENTKQESKYYILGHFDGKLVGYVPKLVKIVLSESIAPIMVRDYKGSPNVIYVKNITDAAEFDSAQEARKFKNESETLIRIDYREIRETQIFEVE